MIFTLLRMLNWVVYIILIILVAAVAPILFGFRPMVVLSPSMEPTYPVGSLIYYKNAGFDDIQIGDAITFKIGDNSLATHRVVEVNADTQELVTKGDNNPSNDPNPVAYTRVEGKTTPFAVPYLGYFTQALRNWYAIAIMAGIILIGIFFVPGKKKVKAEQDGEKHALLR
jgi:signal peptidase I, archaeal type